MRKTVILNSAKCEGCIHCEIEKVGTIEEIYCKLRDRKYIFGKRIEPCEERSEKK